MFNWADRTEKLSGVFVETTDIDELRARRVYRLVIVLWCTWLFFTWFFWFRGYYGAAKVCIVDSLAHVIIQLACRKRKNYRDTMNLCLAASGFGLFYVSISDPALTWTMFFFPVAILVASQLLGTRSAFLWYLVNLVGFYVFFVTIYDLHAPAEASIYDRFVLIIAVGTCVFFCCQQGELYYQERTKNLVQLSQDLQKKSETLRELATTDALTGLINRLQFQERLKEAVSKPAEEAEQFALFLMDMDGFKEINDTLGHPIGDEALVEIARRLEEEYGDVADVARLGGDEFCIIHRSIESNEQADAFAERICKLLTRRYVLDQAEFPLGVSVGYAIYPFDTTSDAELLAYADTAMFYAKEHRLGFARYDADMTNRLIEYRAMQEKLSVALERNEFFLVYQPQVNLRTGKVEGVEALLRWRHDGELIYPDKFIPLLEQSREIKSVGKWIILESCRQLAVWMAEGYDVKVSINVSAVQFTDDDFCENIESTVKSQQVPASMLDFEITEGLLVDDIEQTIEKLNVVKKMGASISIDDFGTGYSSLSYLRQFPIDRLKIDRAFVKDIPDHDDGVIASSIIVLAKSLGMKVLAEGAETEEHLEFLKANDCDEFQGYYTSRPVVAEEVVQFFTPAEPCLGVAAGSESTLESRATS